MLASGRRADAARAALRRAQGIALAYKTSKYSAELVDLVRVSDTKPWPRPPKPAGLVARASAALAASALGRALRSLRPKPPQDDWAYSRNRQNTLVFARLRDARTGGAFCVATYHMPCAFWAPRVMTIHAALAAQRATALAEGAPLVLTGDWNFKPTSAQYELLTRGTLSREHAEYPAAPAWERWRPELPMALRSAYAEAHGAEPPFTNYAQTRSDPVFVETLDYIFVGAGVQVLDADALPALADVVGPFPTEAEPSDHVLLAATLRV